MNEIKINDSQKNKKKGVHFYAALGVCILAVGVAAYTTYDSIKRFVGTEDDVVEVKMQQRYKVQSDSSLENTAKDTANRVEVIEKNFDSKVKNAKPPVTIDKDNQEVVSANTEASGVIVYPTTKDVKKAFSGESPVYSETLKDWRVHNGIDLAAEQGSKIRSITDGKVKEIYNDELYGTTMVIEHEGGFTAYYSGLGETTLVNTDDKVEAGQEIASINTIPCESADGCHLHLSIKRDGNFINPSEILG